MSFRAYNLKKGVKKVTFLIDNLGSGGAQKQIYLLAKGLVNYPVKVKVLCYHTYGSDFYTAALEKIGVEVQHFSLASYGERIRLVSQALQKDKPDVLFSYLYGANLLACTIKLIYRLAFKLIVSDRTGIIGEQTWKDKMRYQLYRFATHVLANSTHTAEVIKKRAPWLKNKVQVIWNMVEPINNQATYESRTGTEIRILHGASYGEHKNHLQLFRAFGIAVEKDWIDPSKVSLHCYGNKMLPSNLVYIEALKTEIEKCGIEKSVFIHDETRELQDEIARADFCILPSIYEGCPNFIVEAMMMRKPVLASNVCSIPDIVPKDGGYLFNPSDAEDIAKSIKRACHTSDEKRAKMGARNENMAKNLFDPDEKLTQYLKLIDTDLIKQ